MNRSNDRAPLVCIFGAPPDNNNLGVCALAHSLVNLIHEQRPGASIAFLNGRRQATSCLFRQDGHVIEARVIPFRLSPRASLNTHLGWILLLALAYRLVPLERFRHYLRRANPWIGALGAADLVADIRGGDSFGDLYGLKRLLIGSLPGLSAILIGRRVVYLPQTFGPYRSFIARHVAAFLLRRAGAIYCRDLASVDLVRGILGRRGGSISVELCPDVAFTLPSDPLDGPAVQPPLDAASRPLIGVNISGLLYAGGYDGRNTFGIKGDYATMIGEVIRGLLRQTGAHLLLTPHVLGDDIETDLAACRAIQRTLNDRDASRVHLLESGLSAAQTKAVIGRCDFFIGSRMHACIAALSQGIPTIGLAYSDKFLGVFKTVGASGMVVDARTCDSERILERCLREYAQRQILSETLKNHMGMVRTRIRQTFGEILSGQPLPQAGDALAHAIARPSIS